MAQASTVNPIERHVEKIVLGLCALVFLYGLFHWGFSSPRELNDRPLAEVDTQLLRQAEEAQVRSEGAEKEDLVTPDYLGQLQEYQQADYARQWGALVAWGGASAPLPVVGGGGGIREFEVARLQAPVPAPPQPKIAAAIELPQTTEGLRDARICHGALIYPWGDLAKAWREELPPEYNIPATPVVLGVEVEVRQKSPGGEWGQPKPLPATLTMVPEPQRKALEDAAAFLRSFKAASDLPVTQTDKLRQALGELARDPQQALLLQPPFWPVYNADAQQWQDWKRNFIEPLLPEIQRAQAEAIAQREREAAEAAEAARAARAAMQPGELPLGAKPYPEPYHQPYPQPATPAYAKPAVGVAVTEVPVPAFSEQRDSGKVLVWFHHVGLQPHTVYQYRLCLTFVNPLLNQFLRVKTEQDAQVTSVSSPWSPWSAEAFVEKQAALYLTGDYRSRNQVRVTVFTRVLGVPVQEDFYVQPGQPIGGPARVSVPDPLGQKRPETQTVDFSTGCVAVAFDFTKPIVWADLRQTTVEMTYLDARGELRTRILLADEESELYRKWRDMVKNWKSKGGQVGKTP